MLVPTTACRGLVVANQLNSDHRSDEDDDAEPVTKSAVPKLTLDSGVRSRVHSGRVANCCGSRDGLIAGMQTACSQCGSKASAVHLLTAKALLTEMALRRLAPVPLYFCQRRACSVVYFTTDGQVYTLTDVRVPVWQKEPAGGRRICYCFDENEASMVRELAETGRCGAVERVRDHIAAARCACEVRNPRGTCCLGDLMKAVARIETECASVVEKFVNG